MQNRFVGDIGDFGKYGMLRYIAKSGYGLGVNWYLTDDGIDSAGNLKGYLTEDSPGYLHCDKDLYEKLHNIVYILKNRNVNQIEENDVLPEDTIYYSKLLKSQKLYRDEWFKESLCQLSQRQILFLDPDNNILLNYEGYK